MKRMIKACLKAAGYEVRRVSDSDEKLREFTVGSLRFLVDPCSVGRTPQGEWTAEGAIRIIRERRLTQLRILDICCGVGIIGLTIYSRLHPESIVTEAAFADINIFNLNSLRRTLAANHLEHRLGKQIRCWLSDGLSNIPQEFDLIVSNPPHFFAPDFVAGSLGPDRLGTYDSAWDFHRRFYRDCHEHLTQRGEVWFLENSAGAAEGDLLPFICANPNLDYCGQLLEPLLPGFFWMMTRKKPIG